jgi:hypothetical protein
MPVSEQKDKVLLIFPALFKETLARHITESDRALSRLVRLGWVAGRLREVA